MLTIKAKENATVEVVEGSFPLGERNTLKVIIEDDVLKQYVKSIGTNTTLNENNLYPYGDFNYPEDMKNVQLNLNPQSTVNIENGYGQNYSRCLHCKTENVTQGLGHCILNPVSVLDDGYKYKLVFYILCKDDTEVIVSAQNIETFKVKTNNEWKQIITEFDCTERKFALDFSTETSGEFYIDSVLLFKAEDEIFRDYYENIVFEIKKYPQQLTGYEYETERIISYSGPDDEDISVLMYFPPITQLDYADNLCCKLDVYLTSKVEEDKILGDTYYNTEDREYIYKSDMFILTGYILPPESDRYELTVGKI